MGTGGTAGSVGAGAIAAAKALEIIREEHRTLAAVLHGLKFMVQEIRSGQAPADFDLFRAMVYYIDAYPERLHHPKEEQFLFRLFTWDERGSVIVANGLFQIPTVLQIFNAFAQTSDFDRPSPQCWSRLRLLMQLTHRLHVAP